MFKNINPQFPFYLLLFLLTIILRMTRAYRSRPKDGSDRSIGYWKNYLFFGFELVNVSAGVFILLSESAASYVGTFLIFYVILVVVSSFLDNDNVTDNIKSIGHIGISVAVLIVTCYAFLGFEDLKYNKSLASKLDQSTAKKWKVAIPYIDMSLNRNFSVKISPVQSYYSTEVTASSRPEAILNARSIFYSEHGPAPFLPKTEKSVISMVIVDAGIVTEEINTEKSK